MKHRVELSARAAQDIKDAYTYIREHGPANADTWKAGLDAKLAGLEMMPQRFGLAPESRFSKVEIHQTFYTNFRILYTIRAECVFVVTFRHGARRFLRRKEINELT